MNLRRLTAVTSIGIVSILSSLLAASRSAAQQAAPDIVNDPVKMPAQLTNISGRVVAGQGENSAIGGFIIEGSAPKTVLVRGIGPSLAAYGISGVLADPMLTLFDASGNVIQTNDNWGDTQRAEIMATGLAPTNSLESAIKATLAPGNYTAILGSKNSSSGVGLVEIYDIDFSTDAAFVNLSVRGPVGTGDNVLIGGLIVGQGDPPEFILRAIGPSLSKFGIQNYLADPVLTLYDVNGNAIATNDNWQDDEQHHLKMARLAPDDARESAIVIELSPGNYTAIVRGQGNTTGTALVEAYQMQ